MSKQQWVLSVEDNDAEVELKRLAVNVVEELLHDRFMGQKLSMSEYHWHVLLGLYMGKLSKAIIDTNDSYDPNTGEVTKEELAKVREVLSDLAHFTIQALVDFDRRQDDT